MSLIKRQKTEPPEDGYILEGHNGPVLDAKFSRSGTYLATSGTDKNIMFWTMDADNYGTLENTHKSAVSSIAWLDDVSVASAGNDSVVSLWDLSSGTRTCKLKCSGAVNEVSVSGDALACVDDAGAVSVWDTRSNEKTASFQTEYPLLTCALEGTSLYCSGIDPTISAYDLRKKSEALSVVSGHASVTSVACGGNRLLARAMDGNVFVYNRADLTSVRSYPTGTADETHLIRACFSNDGVSVYTGSANNVAEFRQSVAKRLSGHNGTVLGVHHHPSESMIVSTGLDGSVIMRYTRAMTERSEVH